MADWYPNSMDSLAAWWANFLLQYPNFESKYAVLHTNNTALDAAGAWVEYWVDARHSFDETSKQISAYFNTIAGNDPNADPPSLPIVALPPNTPAEVPPGIETFIRDIRREVVGMTNYAKADGEAMGFEAPTSANIIPAQVKPTIQVTGAANNHHFSIVVSGRADSTMWDVYIMRKGGNWTKQDTCSGKSADISVPLQTPGDAEQIQVYVQLRKSNADYGQPSDPAYVTLNP